MQLAIGHRFNSEKCIKSLLFVAGVGVYTSECVCFYVVLLRLGYNSDWTVQKYTLFFNLLMCSVSSVLFSKWNLFFYSIFCLWWILFSSSSNRNSQPSRVFIIVIEPLRPKDRKTHSNHGAKTHLINLFGRREQREKRNNNKKNVVIIHECWTFS